MKGVDSRVFTRMLRKDGRTDGSVTISLRNFVGEGIIIRNGAKTISLQTLFGRLNKKRSKNNKSPKLCLGDLIIIRNGAKTISLPNFVWET